MSDPTTITTFDDFHQVARATNRSAHLGLPYVALGVAGEAGEVADAVKKMLRNSDDLNPELSDDDIETLVSEMGDVLWYLAALSDEIGVPLADVAAANAAKLAARAEAGTLKARSRRKGSP